MSKLRISADLSLPLETVTQAIGILARRRAGKSYLARKLAEQLLSAGQQVVIVDPKGDWWGIRSAADGKGTGFKVTILGGERADVPLEAGAGELVAHLVVEERVSVLLDLSLFSKGDVARFMSAFLETVYRLKAREEFRTPMMLIIDEADAIAPQSAEKGVAFEARMLGAANDIVRRGGQRGIGCTMVTQRSAVLSKNVLTQVELLIALKTIAPQDLDAINAWIKAHGNKEQRDEFMATLPALPIGTAWFWSPAWPTEAGIFQKSAVLPIETFDSGATPKPGQKQLKPKTMADVDLDAFRQRMADTIEKAKAEDPKELRRRIAELEREVKAPSAATVQKIEQKIERVEVPVLSGADRKLLVGSERWATRWAITAEEIAAAAKKWTETLAAIDARMAAVTGKPAPRFLPAPRAVGAGQPKPGRGAMHPAAPKTNGAVELGKGERATMIAIAQHPNGVTREQLTVLTGYKRSTRDAYLQRLKAAGFTDGDPIVGTDSGIAWLGPDYDPLPTGDALRAHWLGKLPEGERKILEILCSIYPASSERDAISEKTGYARSSRDAYLQRLGARKLVANQGRGAVVASSELFS